ncbi:acyl-CoA dehydrogenase family protein [Thermodesulfobacteriota bacterium]
MDFSFSKSQELLRKSARDFLKKECQDMAREAEKTDEGYFPPIWEKIADLGWTGIGIDEEYGGIGGDTFDFCILLEEMGRALFPGPFIPAVICFGCAVYEYGSVSQKKNILPGLAAGNLIGVPALMKPDPGAGQCPVEDRLDTQEDRHLLSGTRLFVPYANTADFFLYKFEHAQDDISLFLVDTGNPGVTCTILPTIASDRQCEVVLENVDMPAENRLGNKDNSVEIIHRVRELGSVSHSAYILGMLERVLEMTVDYAKERMQFGKPIGAFQAIQHQCADMLIAVEQVKNLTYQAAWKLSRRIPADREISMAKARASDASRMVSLFGIKIHGGIGIIDEYDLQLYFRRAKAEELAFGDADFHRDIVAEQLGL